MAWAVLGALLLVPGGLTLAAFLVVRQSLTRAAAVDPKWHPSMRVLLCDRLWCFVESVPFPLSLAVLHNEGASVAKPLTSSAADALGLEDDGHLVYPPGDLTSSKGPSVGAGQVLTSNVLRLWAAIVNPLVRLLVVRSSPLKLIEVGQELAATWVHVKILAECLKASGGDERDAARRYNGSGDAAEAYADKAQAFLDALEA